MQQIKELIIGIMIIAVISAIVAGAFYSGYKVGKFELMAKYYKVNWEWITKTSIEDE
jgi:hypothetical protein